MKPSHTGCSWHCWLIVGALTATALYSLDMTLRWTKFHNNYDCATFQQTLASYSPTVARSLFNNINGDLLFLSRMDMYIGPAIAAIARKDYHLLLRRHKLTETVNETRMTLDDNSTVLLITKKFSEEAVKKSGCGRKVATL